jgi:hypothetical protein
MEKPANYDMSRLNEFQECNELYNNKYNRCLKEPVGLNARFSIHMVHDPLTQWYASQGKKLPDFAANLAKMQLTAEELASDKHGKYTVATALRIFDKYIEQLGKVDLERFEVLGAEKYVVDEVLRFGSKADVMLLERATSYPWTAELKFSAWDFVLTGTSFNPQALGQINNTKSRGCLFTLITPKDTKWADFLIIREEIVPKPWEMERWRKNITKRIEDMDRSYELDIWPQHGPKACRRYGGDCYFLGLCEAGAPQEMVQRMPQHDPLAYLGDGQ